MKQFLHCGLITFFVLVCTYPANARTYPPTTAGLRQLVADDAAILPAPYAAKLRKEETDWEKGVGVTCRTYNPPLGQVCSPDAREMINTIQSHIVRDNSYVFYPDEWSSIFPVTTMGQVDLNILTPVILQQNIPQIVSPLTTQAIAFNKAVQDFALKQWNAQGGPPRAHPRQDKSEDLALDYQIVPDPLSGVLSVSFQMDWDTKMGAHGNFLIADFNWNLNAGRELKADDIFASKKPWEKMLDATADASFAKISGSAFPPSDEDNIYDFSLPITEIHQGYNDPHEWRVSATGLTIDTQEGEICGYACGLPNAFISWTILRPYLKIDGLVHDP